MTGRRLHFSTPETPQQGHGLSIRNTSASPGMDIKIMSAISGLSRQISESAAEETRRFELLLDELKTVKERLHLLEEQQTRCVCNGSAANGFKRKRRLQNPKIAEAVRRLHNSEANCRRFDPEQGLNSPYNETVTTYLVGALAASPDFRDEGLDKDSFVAACKTYYETVRRNFRYNQPEMTDVATATKSSSRSRQRRKRLLEARQSVLAADEVDFWRDITLDMMSDEEDGTVDGLSGWIVRPPSFRSQELTNLCATLQTRLEASTKYTALHHRRLRSEMPSARAPPQKYNPEAAKRHLKPNAMVYQQP